MRSIGTMLCAIPASCWSGNKISHVPAELVRRLLPRVSVSERRLVKGLAFDDELQRYHKVCSRLEMIALSNVVFAPEWKEFQRQVALNKFPAIRIGQAYTELIRLGATMPNSNPIRCGATIFAPEEIAAHREEFLQLAKQHGCSEDPAIRHRDFFLRQRIQSAGCGLIEVCDALTQCPTDVAANQHKRDGRTLLERWFRFKRTKDATASIAKASDSLLVQDAVQKYSEDWKKYGQVTQDRGKYMESRLSTQIERGIAHGIPVNLCNQRHNMTTRVLQSFIHAQPKEKPRLVPLEYDVGTPTLPFPVRAVKHLPTGWMPTQQLHIGLVSMRHLPIDRYIDMNWYRNLDIPSRQGMAMADNACYQRSMDQFDELFSANREARIQLHVYHSGYMPAVIGFYRALIQSLLNGVVPVNSLQVIPKLQPDTKGGFIEGRPWPEVFS